MNPLLFLYYELLFYWGWLICFIAIGYLSARYFGWPGTCVGAALISILILIIEVKSVFHDMQVRPELGRDADGVFMFGVICRIGFYNFLVSPFSRFGRKLRARTQ